MHELQGARYPPTSRMRHGLAGVAATHNSAREASAHITLGGITDTPARSSASSAGDLLSMVATLAPAPVNSSSRGFFSVCKQSKQPVRLMTRPTPSCFVPHVLPAPPFCHNPNLQTPQWHRCGSTTYLTAANGLQLLDRATQHTSAALRTSNRTSKSPPRLTSARHMCSPMLGEVAPATATLRTMLKRG